MKYRLKWELPHEAETCLGWLLDARGIDDIEAYVHPSKEYELDPYNLDHIEDGANLLLRHLNNNSKILFVVDADADGYTSSAMLWLYIKEFYPNANLNYYCHEHKSHGLDDRIDELVNSDYNLILCLDSSSFDIEEHARLKEVGIDVLVIDHHDAPSYSENAIVINNQLSSKYDNKGLCGAGVVYKFCEVLDDKLNLPRSHHEKYIDLCAVANIGDVMSFKHPETRYYVTEGLKHIINQGIQALINQQSFSLFRNSNELTTIGIAFYIVPLINAIVRVGTMEEKEQLFELFIEPDKMIQSEKRGAKPGDMDTLANEICRKASNARNRQNRIKDKATELIDGRIEENGLLDNKIIVVELKDEDKIPQELTGLLAQQVVTKYGRPCLIGRENSEGYLRGSLRGNEYFSEVPDLKKFLLKSELMDYVEG